MLNSIINLKEKYPVEKYLVSNISIFLQALLFFLVWAFNNRVLACIIIPIISLLTVLFSNNGLYLCHLFLFDLLSYKEFPNLSSFPITIFIEGGSILLVLILLYIKKCLLNHKVLFTPGPLGVSYILLSIGGFISSIAFSSQYPNNKYNSYAYLTCLIILLITIVYLLLCNTSERDDTNYIVKCMLAWSIIIVGESITFILSHLTNGLSSFTYTDFDTMMRSLGWSNSKNVYALALIIPIPFLALAFNKNKKHVHYLLLLIIMAGLIILI